MPLLTVLLILIAAGVILWLVNSYIPMDGKIKSILNVVVVIIVVVWLLKVFGLFHYLSDIHIRIVQNPFFGRLFISSVARFMFSLFFPELN